jgi:hypothetical protein
MESVREAWQGIPTDIEVQRKADLGWRPAAIIWERAGASDAPEVEVPYGLKVAADGVHLEENQREHAVLMTAMELIVQDQRLSLIADQLNRSGSRTREGHAWNPASVFELLPRLIEAGPRIFSSLEWVNRRKSISAILQR